MSSHDDQDQEGRWTAVHSITHGGGAGAAASVAASGNDVAADFAPGPLPPPPRRYLRPSAYWADRWLEIRRP